MGGMFICLSGICFIIGVVVFLSEQSRPKPPLQAGAVDRVRQGVGLDVRPHASPVADPAPAGPLAELRRLELGDSLLLYHPDQGDLTLQVIGKMVYEELSQQGGGGAWVSTGNHFYTHALTDSLWLMEWQERLYLLTGRVPLTDQDIARDFLPHARRFGQSRQTADVRFDWRGINWQMKDIGKFRVLLSSGEGLHFRTGATGRFVQATESGSNEAGEIRALVVEDYESGGGGSDSAWLGYWLDETYVKEVRHVA